MGEYVRGELERFVGEDVPVEELADVVAVLAKMLLANPDARRLEGERRQIYLYAKVLAGVSGEFWRGKCFSTGPVGALPL